MPQTVVPLARPRNQPTIPEALEAARGLTDVPARQVEIAAGLMGVLEDEVWPLVAKQPNAIIVGARQVVVERRQAIRRRA